MKIAVYPDSNIWNFLFDRNLDLRTELPPDEFDIFITQEAKLEIEAIPPAKAELKAFIERTLSDRDVRTDALFGFADPNLPPEEQRVRGFDEGRWASPQEIATIGTYAQKYREKDKRPSRLYPDEADAALAARAYSSVVLSLDAKKGPLSDVYAKGAKVLYLTNFDTLGMSLREQVMAVAVGESSQPHG